METKILKLLLLLIITPAHTKGAIKCSAFTTTDRTTVICHFGEDVSKTKHNINVEFYYPSMNEDPEIPPSSELTTKMPPHTEEAHKEDSSDAAQAFLVVIGVIVLIFIIAVVIFCLVFYRRTKIIRSWWKSEEGPSGDAVIQNDTRIPSGLPTYFYNMGWRDAWTAENEKTVENRTTQTSIQMEDIASARSATGVEKEEVIHNAMLNEFPMQNLGPSCPLLKVEQSQQGTSRKQHTRPETKEEKKKRLEAEKRKAKEKEKAQWEAEKQRKREEKAKRKAKEERKERLEKETQAAKK